MYNRFHAGPPEEYGSGYLKPWCKALPRIGAVGLVFTTNGERSVSGWSKSKAAIDKKVASARKKQANEEGMEYVEMPGWRVHDLRRTVATGLQRLGIGLQVIEAVLNHVSGSRAGVVGVYQRHQFTDEKRRALDAWADEVGCIVTAGEKKDNVIRMSRGAG